MENFSGRFFKWNLLGQTYLRTKFGKRINSINETITKTLQRRIYSFLVHLVLPLSIFILTKDASTKYRAKASKLPRNLNDKILSVKQCNRRKPWMKTIKYGVGGSSSEKKNWMRWLNEILGISGILMKLSIVAKKQQKTINQILPSFVNSKF